MVPSTKLGVSKTMKIQLLSFHLTLVVLVVVVHSRSFREFSPHLQFFCYKPGFACKSCTELVLCVQNGTNFTEITVATCTGDYTCHNGACTTDPNAKCKNTTEVQSDFMCQSPGMFPDPISCWKYYYCIKTDNEWENGGFKQFSSSCSCGYRYNMRTTFCDIPINNGSCAGLYPLALCITLGQTGNFRENPSLYYICRNHPNDYENLYPFVYACENGKKYNPVAYRCF